MVPLEGEPVAVDLPDGAEYVATAHWGEGGLPVVSVLDRPQQRMTWLAVFPDDGSTRAVRTVTDGAWVDVVPGSGCWDGDGRLLTVEVRDGDYALCSDGERHSPAGLQVRAILDVGDDVLVQASQDPGDQQVWRISTSSAENLTPAPGWHLATRGGTTLVTVAATMEAPLPVTTIAGGETQHEVRSFAEVPLLEPRVTVLPGQHDQPRVAVVHADRLAAGQREASRAHGPVRRSALRQRHAPPGRLPRVASGSPTKASRWWWSTAGARQGRRPGSAPSGTTSPPSCSRTR